MGSREQAPARRVLSTVAMCSHIFLVSSICTIESSGLSFSPEISSHMQAQSYLRGDRLLALAKSGERLCFSSPTWIRSDSFGGSSVCICRPRLQRRTSRAAVMHRNICCRLDVETDHYAVLGVARDADENTIKAAYRDLSRTHHPDVSEDDSDAESFYRINIAYETLSDADTRERYDRARGFSRDTNLIRDLEDMASKMYGAAGSNQHVCNAFCNCADGSVPGSRGPVGKMMRKARYTSAMEDRIKTTPFEAILDMEAQARRAASDAQDDAGMACCTVCGATQVVAGGWCDFCRGTADLQEQRSSVTGVYTMHKAAHRLGSEERHKLVHTHHFERRAHTKRVFPTEVDPFLEQLRSPPASTRPADHPTSAGEEPSGETNAEKTMDRGGVGAGAEGGSVAAPRVERMFLCPTCGCHTTSLFKCDACGCSGGEDLQSGGFVGGITRVHAMHTRSGRASRLDAESRHCLVHPRHVAEHARGDGEKRAPHGRGEEEEDKFVTVRELSRYLEKGVTSQGAEAVEEDKERTEEEWEVLVRHELVRAQAERVPRPAVRTARLQSAESTEDVEEEEQQQHWEGMRSGVRAAASAASTAEATPSQSAAPSAAASKASSAALGVRRVRGGAEEEELRGKMEDLRHFVSHLEAYAARVRTEAEAAQRAVVAMERRQEEKECCQSHGAVRCACCGCDSMRRDRCDCCGSVDFGLAAVEPLEAPVQQRGSGVFGVYTMHGAKASPLGERERHQLMHINHVAETRRDDKCTVHGGAAPQGHGCKPCEELEDMLRLRAEAGKLEEGRRRLSDARIEALKKRRESEALDTVIARHSQQLHALERRLQRVLDRVVRTRRLVDADECYSDVDDNCTLDVDTSSRPQLGSQPADRGV